MNYSRKNIAFLKTLERRLRQNKIPQALYEAESLITHYGRFRRLDLFAGNKSISPVARRSIQKALHTRVAGAPLSYLTGEADFFGLKFIVTKDTLIPRPETELLVEETLKLLSKVRKSNGKNGWRGGVGAQFMQGESLAEIGLPAATGPVLSIAFASLCRDRGVWLLSRI